MPANGPLETPSVVIDGNEFKAANIRNRKFTQAKMGDSCRHCS